MCKVMQKRGYHNIATKLKKAKNSNIVCQYYYIFVCDLNCKKCLQTNN